MHKAKYIRPPIAFRYSTSRPSICLSSFLGIKDQVIGLTSGYSIGKINLYENILKFSLYIMIDG